MILQLSLISPAIFGEADTLFCKTFWCRGICSQTSLRGQSRVNVPESSGQMEAASAASVMASKKHQHCLSSTLYVKGCLTP